MTLFSHGLRQTKGPAWPGALFAFVGRLVRGYAGVRVLVVVAVVDALGSAVLLAGEGVAILGGEVAVVSLAHAVLFGADAGLVGFGVSCALGSNLAVAYAVVDAGLLPALASVDRVALVVGGGLGHGGRCRQDSEGSSESKMPEVHRGGAFPYRLG